MKEKNFQSTNRNRINSCVSSNQRTRRWKGEIQHRKDFSRCLGEFVVCRKFSEIVLDDDDDDNDDDDDTPCISRFGHLEDSGAAPIFI